MLIDSVFVLPWCLADRIVLNDAPRICEKKIHSKKDHKDPRGHEALARNATNGYENTTGTLHTPREPFA